MSSTFAHGKRAIAECDVCGFRYKLKQLKPLVVKTKVTGILACPTCWVKDHPQLLLGMFPVHDPQALRNPRRDNTYVTSGIGSAGYVSDGSRTLQWGWAPVGGARSYDTGKTPNDLLKTVKLGIVTVTTT